MKSEILRTCVDVLRRGIRKLLMRVIVAKACPQGLEVASRGVLNPGVCPQDEKWRSRGPGLSQAC